MLPRHIVGTDKKTINKKTCYSSDALALYCVLPFSLSTIWLMVWNGTTNPFSESVAMYHADRRLTVLTLMMMMMESRLPTKSAADADGFIS